MDYGIISLFVPLFTIVAALWIKDVIVALSGGIWLGLLVLQGWHPLDASYAFFEGIVNIFSEAWIVKTILFSLFVGAIIELLERSGAVDAFIAYISYNLHRFDTPTGAQLLAYVTGLLIFIESSITSLVAGTLARPLCDKYGVSREKLAYICDATSAPVCSLLPLNAWGALLLGLIATAVDAHTIQGNALALLIASLPYNFYAVIALGIAGFVIWRQWHIGPMKEACLAARRNVRSQPGTQTAKPALWPMLLPLMTLVVAVPAGLYASGHGSIFKGSGSTAVYYATLVTLVVLYLFNIISGRLSHRQFMQSAFKGMGAMLPVAVILLLALFIGQVIGQIGTAHYLASLLHQSAFPVWLLPVSVFLISALTAFSTGTSWGTFSIMMPIALALGAQLDADIPMLIGAVVAGGIFGDHASPISDTTVISAMAAGCDTVEHVRTQLPYALLGGGLAAVGFLIAGLWTSL